MNVPDDTPRDFRWDDAPRPDPDPAAALAQALAERDEARRERDRLARRLAGIVAIGQGARYRLAPEPDPDAEPDADPGDPP